VYILHSRAFVRGSPAPRIAPERHYWNPTMAARPLWKGQLRLSLVAMAVELYSATRTGGRIRFRQIHGPSGKPIRYEKVVHGIGPVDRDEIMKGYELDKDSYLLLEPDEQAEEEGCEEEGAQPRNEQENKHEEKAGLIRGSRRSTLGLQREA
jgi:hypothetical protein